MTDNCNNNNNNKTTKSPIKVSKFYIAEHITNIRFCREAVAPGQEKSLNQIRDGIE